MPYSSDDFIDLFDASFLETQTAEERLDLLRHGSVFGYRAKTYRMGTVVECEIFPVWNTQAEASRAKKAKESRPAQKNLNHINAQKKISRIATFNFSSKDYYITFGYDDDNLPSTPREARRDIINYLRRVNRKRKKDSLPPLRYFYVTEFKTESDDDGDAIRVHHHVLMSGDMDRNYLENEWYYGDRPTSRQVQPDDCGITGLSLYLGKAKSNQKFWAYSKNLKIPAPTTADKKITKRQLEKLAIDRSAAAAFFEKAFPGYALKDPERNLDIRHSDFVAGAYLSVRMHLKQMPPGRRKKRRDTVKQ